MLPNCSQMLFFFWFDCQADPARELIVKSWKRGNKTFHDDQIQGAWTGWAWHNHSQPRSHFWPGSTEIPMHDDHLRGSGLRCGVPHHHGVGACCLCLRCRREQQGQRKGLSKINRVYTVTNFLWFLFTNVKFFIAISGLCSSCYWTVHHHLPSFCNSPHRLQVKRNLTTLGWFWIVLSS